MSEQVALKHLEMEVSDKEYAPPGHTACAGCTGAAMLRQILKLLGPKVMMTNPASCSGYYARALEAPLCRSLFAAAASWGTGMRAALDMAGDTETIVLVYAGDGGTYDIGIQALSAAAERNEDFIYACYDNEGYMMTGMQRSSSTPDGAWTSTTPLPVAKRERKKDIISIMAAHRVPYVATATLGYPQDLVRKVLKAKEMKGFRFLNLLAPCCTGWRFPSHLGVEMSRMAVKSRVFRLLEIEDGRRWSVQRPKQSLPVRDFLDTQARFSHFTDADYEAFQREVNKEWDYIMERASSVIDI